MTSAHGTDASHRPRPGPAQYAPDGSRSRTAVSSALLLLVLVITMVWGALSRGVTEPAGADAPAEVFSAARATAAAAPLVAEPRPIGTPSNDRAHENLTGQLTELGFEVRTHEAIGARAAARYAAAGYNRNLVATRPGSDPTGTVLLATHIDSVPAAPGAADAGIGLAVILETVRALGPDALRNDLVVLLVDGEENGLLGADAYVREESAALTEPVVVLNHEARGISGRPTVTRAAGPMHEVLPSMPRPEFESSSDALFAVIPNATDFTVYRDAGWWGMDMAIIDGSWAYHTPQDDADHLDPGTLQHYGDLTLALTRDLGDRDLMELSGHADEHPVQTTVPWGIVGVPPLLVTVLGVAAPLALLTLLVTRRARREVSVLGTMLGSAGAAVGIAGGIAAAVLLWGTAVKAEPAMVSRVVGEPFRSELFIAAELVAAGAVALLVWVLLRMIIGRAAIAIGAALLASVLFAALAVWSPALGGSMVLPAAIAAIGALLAALLPSPLTLATRIVSLLPTGWLLGTQISALAEFGIASAAGGIAGTALLALAAAAPLFVGRGAAQLQPRRRPRRLLPAVLVGVLAVGLTVGGSLHSQASPEPVQERATAHVDGSDGTTTWEVSGVTEWGAGLTDADATSNLPAPRGEVTALEGGRVRIAVHSPRQATWLDLDLTGGGLQDVTIDGTPWGEGQALTQLRIVGVRPGQHVVLEARIEGDPQIVLTDVTFDPAEAGGWTAPPEGVALVHPFVRVSSPVER